MSRISKVVRTSALGAALALTFGGAQFALAGNINIPKSGAHCVDDPNCHNRWHHDIKPVATAKQGDVDLARATRLTMA